MTLYTLRSGGTAHPETSVLQELTELIQASGVTSLGGDNHFKVSEKGSGANMSVDIAAGKAFVRKSTSNTYPIRSTATVNVLIGANSSGNPRIDAIVLYNDLAASPNSDASNVATIVAVAGTPGASPSAPSDSDIATSIGSSNPFIRLANVAVANGASSIVNANITDTRVQAVVSLDYTSYIDEDSMASNSATKLPTQQSVKAYVDSTAKTMTNTKVTKRVGSTASSSTPTPDADSQDMYCLTALAAGATFGAPTGTPTDGQTLLLRIKDNGTARSLAFNAIYRFSTDDPAPTTTTISKTMYLNFAYNSADSKWDHLAVRDNL